MRPLWPGSRGWRYEGPSTHRNTYFNTDHLRIQTLHCNTAISSPPVLIWMMTPGSQPPSCDLSVRLGHRVHSTHRVSVLAGKPQPRSPLRPSELRSLSRLPQTSGTGWRTVYRSLCPDTTYMGCRGLLMSISYAQTIFPFQACVKYYVCTLHTRLNVLQWISVKGYSFPRRLLQVLFFITTHYH